MTWFDELRGAAERNCAADSMREALTITDRPSLFSYRGLSFAAALLGLACSASAVQVGDVVSFAGDGGLRQVTLVQAAGERAFLGTLDGYVDALNAVLTETDRGWRMSVDDWRQAKTWVIVNADGRTSVRSCAKPRRTAGSCRRYRPPREASSESSRPLFRSIASGGLTAGWEVDSVTNEIDILVVFDRSAKLRLARMECTAETFAAEQIAKMNATLANSGLADDFRVTLAGVFNASFDVTRDCGRDEDDFLFTALENVCEGSASMWKDIRDERERLGADAVAILVDPDWTSPEEDACGTVGISCGLENDPEHGLFGPTPELLSELREYAYSVCNICAVSLNQTFAHEIGHIMGAGHSELLSPLYSSPGPQLFPYSAALMYLDPVDAGYYYTVMGYDSTDGSDYSPTYVEVPRFSSPDLCHPETGTVLGDADHDNVRSLREMYAVISQYRVNAARRETPPGPSAVWDKARTLTLVAEEDGAVAGVVQLKVGKMNKKTRRVSVSGTFTGIDGKKIAVKMQEKTLTVEDDRVAVTLTNVKQGLEFRVVITPEGASGDGSGLFLDSERTVGGALSDGAAEFRLDPDFDVGGEGAALTEFLPFEKTFQTTEKKWIFDKAAQIRLVRNRQTKVYELTVNTSSGRTNLSALKLNYTAKTGFFKGTFKAWSLANVKGRDRLMSYVVTVTGLVVDGQGVGVAICKKTGASAPVVIEQVP